MGGSFDLGNYVEVDERIRRFYEMYPEGRIATIGKPEVITVGNRTFIACSAAAWKKPGDEPCIGNAWEPFPGSTSYTKDSEAMNAETSAWGRALVAAGILSKGEKVASRNEVRNRSAEKNAPRALDSAPKGTGAVPPASSLQPPASSGAPPPAPPSTVSEIARMAVLYDLGERITPPQNRIQIDALVRHHGYDKIKERLEGAAK